MNEEFEPMDYLSVAIAERKLCAGEITQAEFDAIVKRKRAQWQKDRDAALTATL